MQISFSNNILSIIILIVFGLTLVIQLVYHWLVFSKVAFYKKNRRSKTDDELEPVSIVLWTRDSYEYLMELLPLLLKQDYPDFEIVVVNDCSEDGTEDYLKDLERIEPKVKPVLLHQHLNFFNGKKFPLSMGIKSAKNDLLIFTDVNCRPDTDKWLRSVVDCYKRNTEVVIGYCPMMFKKGLLNRIMRFDALQQGLLYLSSALSGHPYRGTGKNLSYRKEAFYRNKGFTSHYTTSVGDDDLFVSQVATKKNTEVLIDADNAVRSIPTHNFNVWMHQKSSRYSTIPQYDMRAKVSQGIFLWSQFLFYASFIALLCLPHAFNLSIGTVYYIPILAVFFLLRFGTQMFIYHKASKRLGEKGLIPGLILYDLLLAILSPLQRLMGRMKIGVE